MEANVGEYITMEAIVREYKEEAIYGGNEYGMEDFVEYWLPCVCDGWDVRYGMGLEELEELYRGVEVKVGEEIYT